MFTAYRSQVCVRAVFDRFKLTHSEFFSRFRKCAGTILQKVTKSVWLKFWTVRFRITRKCFWLPIVVSESWRNDYIGLVWPQNPPSPEAREEKDLLFYISVKQSIITTVCYWYGNDWNLELENALFFQNRCGSKVNCIYNIDTCKRNPSSTGT